MSTSNIFGLQESSSFARALCASEGIRVKEDPSIVKPHSTKDGSIIVGTPSLYTPEGYMGTLHREISKQLPKMRSVFYEKEEQDGSLRSVAKGIIQSLRSEYELNGQYEGRDRILAQEYQRNIREAGGLQQILKGMPEPIASLLHIGNELRNTFQGYVPSGPEPPMVEKLNGVREKWLSLETPDELESLLKYIEEESQQQQEQEGQSNGSSGTEGDAEGEPQTSDGTGQDSEGSDGAGEGSGEPEAGAPESDDGGQESGEPSTGDSKGDPESKGDGPPGVGFSEAAKKLEECSLVQPPLGYGDGKKESQVRYKQMRDVVVEDLSSSSGDTRESKRIQDTLGSFSLSRRIQKYMLAQKQVGYEYGLKRGRLSQRSISKLYVSEQSPRIFKQRNSSRIKEDSAVFILGDCSGSMEGQKYVMSSACQISLSELLQSLRIPHEMMQFTTRGYSRMHFIMKYFHEGAVSRDKLLCRYGSPRIYMGSNADGEALMDSAQALMKRPEKNKILFVLSDGQPASGNGCSGYLADVCKTVEDTSSIQLYGIGIMDSSVKSFYKNNRVVKQLVDLEHVLVELLKENLLC